MAIIDADLTDGLEGYLQCEKCGCGLDRLVISGVGDWQKTIHCPECLHIREPVSLNILVALKARKDGMPKEKAEADMKAAQAEYEATLARIAERG